MRLGPAGYFHGLGESTDVAHVDADEVRQTALDEWYEGPFAGDLFADRKRHVGHAAQRGVCLGILGADRLLQEIERAAWHPLTERRRFGDAQPVVVVDA